MREEAARHGIVRLDRGINVAIIFLVVKKEGEKNLFSLVAIPAVDADRDTQKHVLGTLDNLVVDAEEVRALKGLEAKIAGIR